MPAADKVGSWLGQKGAKKGKEAYESDSEASDITEPEQNAPTPDNDEVVDDDEIVEEDKDSREANIDWADVLPKIRPALLDPSKKRREQFASRYLYVTPESPAPESTGQLLQQLLMTLTASTERKAVDLIVQVLMDLVRRDEEQQAPMKLGDKLVKWVCAETAKAVDAAKSAPPQVLLPQLNLILALITTLLGSRSDAFVQSAQLKDLLLSLAAVTDGIEARQSPNPRKAWRVRHKVNIRVWRVLRLLRENLQLVAQTLLKAPQPLRSAVLLGNVVGVALRVKMPKGKAPAREAIEAEKPAIIDYYSTNILGSKVALQPYLFSSLSEFLSTFVTDADLTGKLIPATERMMLRSPEIALPVTTALLDECKKDISAIVPGKLVAGVISSSKSSNAETRAKSVNLFQAIVRNTASDEAQLKIANEVLSLPKTGKTANADQRVALYNMVSSIPTSAASVVVDTLPPLIAKESNEAALNALGAALGPHLAAVLVSDKPVAAASASALTKELASSKLSVRRAVSTAVGEAAWTTKEPSAEGQKLLDSFAAPLESNLKTASANVPSNPTGFLEGYVAVALALGPLKDSKLATSAPMKEVLTVSPKPSFVLNDKAWIKLPTETDELWLLRAVAALIANNNIEDKAVRVALGLALIHLAFESKHPNVRREVYSTVSDLAAQHPRNTAQIVREALISWLRTNEQRRAAARAKGPTAEEEENIVSKSREIGRLLSAAVSRGSADQETLEDIAADLIVIAHHPEIGEESQVSWITIVQSLGLDPANLVSVKRERILDLLWEVASAPPKDARFAEAAYRAIATLAFVDPVEFVGDILAKIKSDLDPAALDFIGIEERGIWQTPSDQMFTDVLSKKSDQVENKNRKDYAVEKWEQEVREQLAKKKATTPGANLSKQDKALVAAQLRKEADVREEIALEQARLKRGLELVSSLAASGVSAVESQLGTLAHLLLSSVFGAGAFLVDDRAFEVFIQISGLASDRLDEYRRLTAAAILRGYEAPFVPEDYLQEGACELVTRILHQILFLVNKAPLDPTTYALVSMLLHRVVAVGGIGCQSAQSDEAQEQLTLVVGIIGACVGEFQDDAYPRLETIEDLLKIISTQPRLAKDASSALADLGTAIRDVATPEEIAAIIKGTLSGESNVRNSALQALQPIDLTELNYSEELFIATHDPDAANAALAEHLWEDNGLDIPETYLDSLVPYLCNKSGAVRKGTAEGLTDAAEQHPSQIEPTIKALEDLYVAELKALEPEIDRFGMVIPETVNKPDPYQSRVAIAEALEKFAPLIPDGQVEPTLKFLIEREPLGDRHEEVRRAMLNAATTIVDIHGGKDISGLMSIFETNLATPSTSQTTDYVKESVVVLFGRLASHLESSDKRIPNVVDRLVEALNTPSELVQSAVADCLPALVQDMGEEAEYLVDRLFSTLTTGKSYAARRGAAYGLAGVVKGRGLRALKDYDLMDKFTEAAEDKSSYEAREGAVFAFETLTATLGRVFEPYIVEIIPLMLKLFGDSNTYVREATQYAAKIIMSKISGHCVKIILPTLLDALEEKQWRTKKGSIELLGSMAFCAPRQLSLSLPTIIPHLTGVINDSHAQVKSAANASLKRFGEVLNNPEVKSIQSTLMKALADPSANITKALSSLLKTTFEHYLDAPSLALVMPIIDRGLRQRSSEIKRKSVQIVGNMASLTDSRDLVPYLHELMPLIHEVLVDPVPEARATAAKSLGTLVERLGETNFPDLVDKLLQTLRSDTSGVDRQGAAQGLSEVLAGLGIERLEALLPDVITSTASPRAYVREGFISLLIYLPATFGHRFSPHLARIIPPILNGLADESEYVRDASMRAGKMIIANYSNKAIELLLPELEKGMLDSSWRIRQSSISLTGELLYRVTGISGKVELEEDETAGRGADQARKALLEALGQERRDRVLATLYIVRQDTVSTVRQASIHIWKALVHNTPRTTREILPMLMQLLVSLLGSPHMDQQETASRTIGELCRKNGERIVGEIVPILKKAISSTDSRTKEGACLAFSDVMQSASKDAIENHEDVIISCVRGALVDPNPDVRTAAAQTFDTMQQYMGAKAIDQTIPTLLEAMRGEGEASETALQALKEVMNVRANSVFPVLIPTLTAQPISAFNARAISALVRVAGSALNRRIDTLLSALVKSLEANPSEDVKPDLEEAIEALCASVEDSDGIHLLMMLLFGWAKDVNPTRRATACNIFGTLCQVNEEDMDDYRVDWIRILVGLMDDSDEGVVTAAWEALDHFVKTIHKDELQTLVVPLRRTIESTGAPGRTVPGFSRPKGVQSLVPILLAGVLSGTQEQREQAAFGIGDLVQRTSEAAIKPYIIQLTGPLIRVISGQSIAPQIKGAILQTLTVLLEQVPQLVRPFHPQLTRTFVKSASDPAALSIRVKAATGLGELMKHQPRVDPLITELIGAVQTGEREVAPSVVSALAAVCNSAGQNIGAAAKTSIVELIEEAFMGGHGDSYNNAIASVAAGLAKADAEALRPIVDTFLAPATPPASLVSICIRTMLEDSPDAFYELECTEDVAKKIMVSLGSDAANIARPSREARELFRSQPRYKDDAAVQAIVK